MDRRCLLPLLTASVLLTLAAPLVAGQAVAPFVVSAEPGAASVFPGETATFTITIANPSIVLDRSAAMNVSSALPPDWTYSFTPDPVNVTQQSNATTTLSLFVPASAAPQTLDVVYEAGDGLATPARSNVTVTVKARPVSTVESAPLPAPRITLSVTPSSSAPSGTTAQAILTVTHDDPDRSTLAVQLSASAPAPWMAYLKPADQNRNLVEFGQSAHVPVFVDIPTLSQDETVEVIVRALVGDTPYTARWSLTGLAAAQAPGAGTTADASPAPEGASAPAGGNGFRASGPNFELRVEPLEIDVAPESATQATVKLANTGSVPLTIALSAPAPATWRPIEFETKDVTLAAGESRDIIITLHAPEGILPGGRTDVAVSGVSGGIVRRGDLIVHTIPALTPRDESPASAATTEAPATVDGSGLPALGAPALVAVGLAAAGSTALVVVNRPLREKLLWGAMGLYTRLARPDVLGHEDREKLYKLVELQPGIHFHALQRDLAWNTGTLTYHVRVLEKHGFVVSRRDGLYRRFYLSGAAPRKEVFENQGPTGLRADVMEAIRNSPGISQSDLALGLGANKQTVNYHVKALERAGTIRVEKRGRDTFLFPGGTPTPPGPGQARA